MSQEHVILEEGKTYKINADIGDGKKWYTAIRRTFDSGEPSIYYVEDDFEDYYYDDDEFDSCDVREIE